MANPKNRGLPPGIAGSIHSAPIEKQRKVYGPGPVEDNQIPIKPAGKIGRPKGPVKTKKTLYFTNTDNFQKVQKALVRHGDVLIKDESEIADLALTILASMVNDLEKVKTIINVYEAEIKFNS